MLRLTFSCCLLAFLCAGTGSIAHAQTPLTPPVTPLPAPVVETPDFPGAVWEPASPANFQPSTRPSVERPIDRIVIHDIEGSAISAVRWFQNPQAQASSHYVVDGKTGRVYQLIKERDIAWHAGDRVTNARSVGIEHEGFAYRPGFYNPTEYEASASLVRAISARYTIPRDRTHIIGHFEVPDTANPGHFGGRNGHTDPGPYWDWDYFMTLVRSDARSETAVVPPLVLHPGETKEAVFTLTNTGDDPWPADTKAQPGPDLRKRGPVYLGAWGTAPGSAGSVFYGTGWVSPRFVSSSSDGDTAPGAAARFVVPFHAPVAGFGETTETFRLVKVPVAPMQSVPFGPIVSVSVRLEPWEILVPLPASLPAGWQEKNLLAGERVWWRNAGAKSSEPLAPIRWQADLPISGSWDVYVRCPVGQSRSTRAVYQVSGVAGTIPPVIVNQRLGGGQWQKLGRFPFTNHAAGVGVRPGAPVPAAPGIQGTIELLADSNAGGVLVAGEVRFVGPYPPGNAPAAP